MQIFQIDHSQGRKTAICGDWSFNFLATPENATPGMGERSGAVFKVACLEIDRGFEPRSVI